LKGGDSLEPDADVEGGWGSRMSGGFGYEDDDDCRERFVVLRGGGLGGNGFGGGFDGGGFDG